MKTWKRALALVLALVMALSLVALPSFAAGEEDSAGLPNGVSVVNPRRPHRRGHWHGNEQDPAAER